MCSDTESSVVAVAVFRLSNIFGLSAIPAEAKPNSLRGYMGVRFPGLPPLFCRRINSKYLHEFADFA